MYLKNSGKTAEMREVLFGVHEGEIRVDVWVTPGHGFCGHFDSYDEGMAWLNDRFLGEWKVV